MKFYVSNITIWLQENEKSLNIKFYAILYFAKNFVI